MSNASQAAVLRQRPQKVEPKLIPPRGSRPVGVFEDGSPTGAIIYEMMIVDDQAMKKAKKQALHPTTGKPLWKRNNAGQPILPVLRLPAKPIMRKKRFILRGYKTGTVRMIENFELSPERQAERDEQKKVQAFSDDLARAAIRAGYETADAFIAAMVGGAVRDEEGALHGDAEDVAMVEEANELITKQAAGEVDVFADEEADIEEDIFVEADPAFDADSFRALKDAAIEGFDEDE